MERLRKMPCENISYNKIPEYIWSRPKRWKTKQYSLTSFFYSGVRAVWLFRWPCVCSVYQCIGALRLWLHTLFVRSTHYICGKRPVCTQVDTIHTAGKSMTQKANSLLLQISALLYSATCYSSDFDMRMQLSELWRGAGVLHLFSQSLTVEILTRQPVSFSFLIQVTCICQRVSTKVFPMNLLNIKLAVKASRNTSEFWSTVTHAWKGRCETTSGLLKASLSHTPLIQVPPL